MKKESFWLESINLSEKKGTVKAPVEQAELSRGGLTGDAHRTPGSREVSLLAADSVRRFGGENNLTLGWGDFAENLTIGGGALSAVAILDRFEIGDSLLEVTQIGKQCHGTQCAIFQQAGSCIMPREGLFCRVLKGGEIRRGDAVRHIPRSLQIEVITLSDRAYSGVYEDRSGPAIMTLLEEFWGATRWHQELRHRVLPDDERQLRDTLSAVWENGADLIFTTGGTGLGSRDRTPDVVRSFIDREIPGIMEHIRLKYGAVHPHALLSRSVAGVRGKTQIYTLPGSLKAVREYVTEITAIVEHAVLMLHDIDNH